MLQRIQSVYLGMAAIAGILLFFFPLASFYHEDHGNYKLFILGIQYLDPDPKELFGKWFTIPLILITFFSILLDVVTVFFFKKRWLQRRLIAFSGLLMIVLVMIIFFFYATKIETITHIEPEYNFIGMMLPLLSLVLLILANYAIRKDDALVKSADRLR